MAVEMGDSFPSYTLNERVVRDAEPHRTYGGGRRRWRNSYGGRRSGPNQALKQHGKTKFATGAGLWALGAITGNQGWQNTGAGLAKLGLLSKLGAHFI